MRLYIELYLDEDVDVLLADLLRARGYNVVTTVEAGNRHQSDNDQLAYAVAHQRAIVTHNRGDFEALAVAYFDTGKHHCGIVTATQQSVYQLRDRLVPLLEELTAEDLDDQLIYL
jgi:predicted nuclease of predicted toxin-antitoxin system